MRQSVLITGAGKGLGFSLAGRFLRGGFYVCAGEHRKASSNLQALAEGFPQTLAVIPLDVADLESVRQAAELVSRQTPALDILINNAAIYPADAGGALQDLVFTSAQRLFDVNALGPLRVTQQFYPLLEKGERKLIINISSEAGSITDCWRKEEYFYCMSKSALNMQSKILQNDLEPRGFKVLAIQPGWMRTDMGGPDADIHPDVAAEGIFRLAMKDWRGDPTIYMDYNGTPLAW